MKILVVDDDKFILHAIAHELRTQGFEVITAENGYEALDAVASQKLNLIISDIMMPEISGLSLLSMLKQFYFNSIPVIIISSLDQADLVLNTIGLGAVDYITKPIDFKELSSRIRKYAK